MHFGPNLLIFLSVAWSFIKMSDFIKLSDFVIISDYSDRTGITVCRSGLKSLELYVCQRRGSQEDRGMAAEGVASQKPGTSSRTRKRRHFDSSTT